MNINMEKRDLKLKRLDAEKLVLRGYFDSSILAQRSDDIIIPNVFFSYALKIIDEVPFDIKLGDTDNWEHVDVYCTNKVESSYSCKYVEPVKEDTIVEETKEEEMEEIHEEEKIDNENFSDEENIDEKPVEEEKSDKVVLPDLEPYTMDEILDPEVLTEFEQKAEDARRELEEKENKDVKEESSIDVHGETAKRAIPLKKKHHKK